MYLKQYQNYYSKHWCLFVVCFFRVWYIPILFSSQIKCIPTETTTFAPKSKEVSIHFVFFLHNILLNACLFGWFNVRCMDRYFWKYGNWAKYVRSFENAGRKSEGCALFTCNIIPFWECFICTWFWFFRVGFHRHFKFFVQKPFIPSVQFYNVKCNAQWLVFWFCHFWKFNRILSQTKTLSMDFVFSTLKIA